MPITAVQQDPENLTLTIVGEFPVSKERLWQAWMDPRQLEQFWGSPTWPAKFLQHEPFVGGESRFVMTGPDGDKSAGFWEFLALDPGESFTVRDGFMSPEGERNLEMPTCDMTITFDETESGSRFTAVTQFPSLETLEQLVSMGMAEGITAALSQMDAVLADLAAFAADLPAQLELLSDTQARISRIIRGPVENVWRAHHEPELLRRWMLGPDGWRLSVCEVALEPGQWFRYEWESDHGEPGFGFIGEALEMRAPHFAVTTEAMIGQEEFTHNAMTLTPIASGTLLTLVITYPSKEMRDAVLATGMVDGLEMSYARMESDALS